MEKINIKKLIELAMTLTKTKSELSRKLGVHWTTIFRWSNDVNRPNYSQFVKLLEIAEQAKKAQRKHKKETIENGAKA